MSNNRTMTDAAFDCLSKRKKEMEFPKLWKEVLKVMDIPEDKQKKKKAQFYSELMMDNRFASLPNNKWDLRNRRKFNELQINQDEIGLDDDDTDDLDNSGLDLPTGDDAFDN